MADKVWVSDGGLFKPVKKLWVADNGTFKESKSMFTSDNGVFKDTSVAQPVYKLHALSTWAGVSAHAEVNVSWNVEYTEFDISTDAIVIIWKSNSTGEQGKVFTTSLVGQTTLVLPYAEHEYSIGVSAMRDGVWSNGNFTGGNNVVLTPLATTGKTYVSYRTSRTPAITGYSNAWSTPTQFGVSWTVGGYITNHYVSFLDPNTLAWAGGNWIGPGNGPGTRFDASWNYPQRTKFVFEIMAARGNSLSDPVRFSGTTGSLYTPGDYYVNPQQRRTWVKGTKKVKRGYNHPSEEFLWHGDGGEWNEYGTQLACFYYWNEGSTINPFQTVLNQLNNGARCTGLAINVYREFHGYNYGLHVWAQTHGHKWAPPGDALNLHDNLHKSSNKVWAENNTWIQLDPVIAPWLVSAAGNGIALGNTGVNKDYYFNMFRKLSGSLRFTLV